MFWMLYERLVVFDSAWALKKSFLVFFLVLEISSVLLTSWFSRQIQRVLVADKSALSCLSPESRVDALLVGLWRPFSRSRFFGATWESTGRDTRSSLFGQQVPDIP